MSIFFFLVWPAKKRREILLLFARDLLLFREWWFFWRPVFLIVFFSTIFYLIVCFSSTVNPNLVTSFFLSSIDVVIGITLSICSSCPNFFSACQCPPCHRLWRYSIVLLCLSLVFLPVLLFFDGVIVIGDHLILLVIDDEHFLLSSPLSFTGRLSSVVCRWRHRLLDVY